MENVGDWLYVVIIIIAAISSVIGSISKKNKQAAGKQQPREIITEEWEDKEFRNGGDTETQHSVFRENLPEATPLHQQTIHPGHRQINKKAEKDYSTFKKETVYSSLNTEEEKTAVSLEDMPANTEEWRKAFIYNEVFKRKY
ncbi:MAG: hypothetical protein LBL07_16260 [Tannerella sp.]|nr:hypothetical protein [Tannerella sp.]